MDDCQNCGGARFTSFWGSLIPCIKCNGTGKQAPDAAAALTEAQATIAWLETALGRINDKAFMNAGEFARYVREECAALTPGKGE
jgi:hypothetical protein